jgi:hypothetical protein
MVVEPQGSYRETNVTIFDLRAEKQFRLGGGRRVGLFFDLYNIMNSSNLQDQDSIVGRRTVRQPDGSSLSLARFLRPTVIIAPRIAKFGLKFSF